MGQLPRRVQDRPAGAVVRELDVYAVLATVFMLVSSVPAAYVLAKFRFRGSNALFLAIIVAMMLPPQVTSCRCTCCGRSTRADRARCGR